MSRTPAYTEYHPRWYRRRVSTYWWMGRWTYLAFILRELSSIFIAWFIYFFLRLVHALGRGDAAYREFLAWTASPGILALNGITFAFVLFHAVTWFNLAPQAMVVHLGGRRLPGAFVAGANYVAWVVATAFVLWIVGR